MQYIVHLLSYISSGNMSEKISLLVVFSLSFVIVSMAFSSPHHDDNVGRFANRKMVKNGREIPLGAHEEI